jgi:hypothetical protein
MVAQESMRIICHRYGITPETVLGRRVSHESASINPIHSLRLAREDASDFVKTVIDGIRNLFKRLLVTIKKLYAKAVVMFSRTEKIAIKLADKVEEYGEAPADAKFSDSEVAKITSKLGVVIIAEGGNLPKEPFQTFVNYFTIISNAKYISTYTNVLKDTAADQLSILKLDTNAAEEAAKKVNDEFFKKLEKIYLPPIFDEILNYEGKGKFIVPEKGTVFPFAITGTKVRAFVITEDMHFKSETLTAKPEALKTIQIDIPSRLAIIRILRRIADFAKESKEFEAAALKETDEADKILADLSKEIMKGKLTPAAKRSVTNYSSAVRIVTANLAVDSILAQVNGAKAILEYCVIASKKFSKS